MELVVLLRDKKVQIVLTPETPGESALIRQFEGPFRDAVMGVDVGSFYECRGGWDRDGSKNSLMIWVKEKIDEPSGS